MCACARWNTDLPCRQIKIYIHPESRSRLQTGSCISKPDFHGTLGACRPLRLSSLCCCLHGWLSMQPRRQGPIRHNNQGQWSFWTKIREILTKMPGNLEKRQRNPAGTDEGFLSSGENLKGFRLNFVLVKALVHKSQSIAFEHRNLHTLKKAPWSCRWFEKQRLKHSDPNIVTWTQDLNTNKQIHKSSISTNI